MDGRRLRLADGTVVDIGDTVMTRTGVYELLSRVPADAAKARLATSRVTAATYCRVLSVDSDAATSAVLHSLELDS